MQKLELYYLIDKQLDDVLAKASKILAGKPSDHEIAEFYEQSAGVKRFLSIYIAHSGIQKFLLQVPDVEYKSSGVIDNVLSLPLFSPLRLSARISRRKAIEGIKAAHNIYATIFYLHQAETVV